MDETQPLLRDPSLDEVHPVSEDVVDFDPQGDPENPREWPRIYKWGIVALLALMAFTV
jgi:hypothetical protein